MNERWTSELPICGSPQSNVISLDQIPAIGQFSERLPLATGSPLSARPFHGKAFQKDRIRLVCLAL